MSQRTQAASGRRLLRKGGNTKMTKLRLLGAVGAAVALVPVLATGPAQATTTEAAAVRGFHAFNDTGFSGTDRWYDGNVGQCYYVGDGWNDTINSARTESGRVVELWDNAGCTGGSIVIDRTGYSSIGNWVSAYRIR